MHATKQMRLFFFDGLIYRSEPDDRRLTIGSEVAREDLRTGRIRMSQRFGSSIHQQFEREASSSAMDEMENELGEKGPKGEIARHEMGDGIEEEAGGSGDAEKDWFDEYSGERGLDEASDEKKLDQGTEHSGEGADTNIYDALEEAAAGALDAEDSGEFYRRLFSRLRAAARSAAPPVSALGVAKAGEPSRNRSAGPVSRLSREAAAIVIRQILPLLRQYAVYGCDEAEALEDLADWFAEEESFATLPILGGLAARALVWPLMRRAGIRFSHPEACALVRGATQAGRALIRAGGGQALRALPDITRSVLRSALRQRLPVKALPAALRRTVEQVAAKPRPQPRFDSTEGPQATPTAEPRVLRLDTPQRLQITGPVEITIVPLKIASE
jgi:hypothetical protein